MAEVVRQIDYYYVTVRNEAGAGFEVLSALKDRGVNLLAYLGFPRTSEQSQIDLVPENADGLKRAAGQSGLTLIGPKRAFLIQGDDRTGVVADLTRRLANTKINITAAAATSAGAGRYGMILWVAPADYDRAAKVLGA